VGFDVAGRLAEGVAAVANTQIYVQACALRGYHHPELTVHGAQVEEWLRTEEGLDLRVLDADCAALRSAAQSAAEGLECVRTQVAALDAAWEGEGGNAAADFLRRHADSAARVVAAAETAAAVAERLRDELWRIVGDKVTTTVSIDDRTSAQRTAWLTAARAVMAGEVADDANRVVEQEITPYVTTAIAGEWLPAMRASVDAVGSVYREAVDAVASRTGARFDIPGDLGPRPTLMSTPVPAGVSAAAMTVPAAAMPASLPFAEAAPTSVGSPAPPSLPPVSTGPAVPQPDPLGAAMSPAGGMPTALPDPLGGVAGLPGRLAETLGGLFDAGPALGGPATAPDLPGSPELPEFEPDALDEESLDEEPFEEERLDEEPLDEEPEDEDLEDEAVIDEAVIDEDGADEEPVIDEEAGAQPAEAADDCPEPEEPSIPAEPTPPVPPPPPPPAVDPAATPCEIAADELPQVGE
jgi:hypothetical protein